MRAAVLASLLLLPLMAAAQVYTWKDASGKIHYTDRPPADGSLKSRKLGPENFSQEESSTARAAAAEKRLEAKKQSKDAAEKSAKAEQERSEEAQRQRDCERARIAAQGIESGQVRYRVTASGEREVLEDEARESELSNARRIMDATCGPRPAQPAATPAKKPGY